MISGVYRITNLINNKSYIGSSIKIDKRFNVHKCLLLGNKHHCKHLQNAVNKYGFENFKFEIISTCPSEYCIKMEQWFIDNIKPEYNILKRADSRLGVKTSEETKEKQREAKLKNPNFYWKGKKRPEVSEWLGKKNIGRKQSEEEKLKRSNSRKEYFKNNPPKKGYKQSEETVRKSAVARTGLRRGRSLKHFKLTHLEMKHEIILYGIDNVKKYLKCHVGTIHNVINAKRYDNIFGYKIEIHE